MNSKITVWFSLAATLAPTLMGVLSMVCFMSGWTKGVLGMTVAAAFMIAPMARIAVNLSWVAHVLMSKEIDPIHKIFWTIGFLLEAFGSWCLGSFSLVGIIYWFKEVYGPYRDARFHRAMRDESI